MAGFQLRGQAAIEFMAAFGFLMLMFVIIQIVFIQSQANAISDRTVIYARRLATETAAMISLAASSEGISSRLEVPSSLGEAGEAFTLTISNSSVLVSYEYNGENAVWEPVRVQDVRDNAARQVFNLTTGIYTVYGTGGVVHVFPQ